LAKFSRAWNWAPLEDEVLVEPEEEEPQAARPIASPLASSTVASARRATETKAKCDIKNRLLRKE
jgi:hypothetical protein